eukprot:gb/GEZN01013499.1/.p1 GENE.gb/GEZN01013499.1/~~gb/GEZN01013499.1/.p1  ORF type:complete len:313 (-),score=35.88 gb/GEZN01013499.1/:48-986(-)
MSSCVVLVLMFAFTFTSSSKISSKTVGGVVHGFIVESLPEEPEVRCTVTTRAWEEGRWVHEAIFEPSDLSFTVSAPEDILMWVELECPKNIVAQPRGITLGSVKSSETQAHVFTLVYSDSDSYKSYLGRDDLCDFADDSATYLSQLASGKQALDDMQEVLDEKVLQLDECRERLAREENITHGLKRQVGDYSENVTELVVMLNHCLGKEYTCREELQHSILQVEQHQKFNLIASNASVSPVKRKENTSSPSGDIRKWIKYGLPIFLFILQQSLCAALVRVHYDLTKALDRKENVNRKQLMLMDAKKINGKSI